METRIRLELEKAVMNGDSLGFRDELVKKLSDRIMMFSAEDLWLVFQKAAGNSLFDWDLLTERVYDDGIDYSAQTKKFKSQVVDHFVNEIIGFIRKRRGSSRFDFKKDVDIYPLDSVLLEPFTARSENVSDNGMLIRSSTSFKEGEKLELRVHAQETSEPVRVFGSVVRVENALESVFEVGVYINSIFEHKGNAIYTTAEALCRLSQVEKL